MRKAVATLKLKSPSSASARSHKGKCAPGKNTTTGKHDGRTQSQAPMVPVVVVAQEGQLVSLVGVPLEGLLVAMALEGQLGPQKRPRRGENSTFAGLRPPVGKEVLERHNEMINACLEALQAIRAETKTRPPEGHYCSHS